MRPHMKCPWPHLVHSPLGSFWLLGIPVVSSCTGLFPVVDILHPFFTQDRSLCLEGTLTNSLPLLAKNYSTFTMDLKISIFQEKPSLMPQTRPSVPHNPLFCFLSSCIICNVFVWYFDMFQLVSFSITTSFYSQLQPSKQFSQFLFFWSLVCFALCQRSSLLRLLSLLRTDTKCICSPLHPQSLAQCQPEPALDNPF